MKILKVLLFINYLVLSLCELIKRKLSIDLNEFTTVIFDYNKYSAIASDQHLIMNAKEVSTDDPESFININFQDNDASQEERFNYTVFKGSFNNYDYSKIDSYKTLKYKDFYNTFTNILNTSSYLITNEKTIKEISDSNSEMKIEPNNIDNTAIQLPIDKPVINLKLFNDISNILTNWKGSVVYEVNDSKNKLKINTNQETTIFLTPKNTQFSTTLPKIENLFFNGKILEEKNYFLNYSLADDTYFSSSFETTYKNDVEYNAYCRVQSFRNNLKGDIKELIFDKVKQFRISNIGIMSNQKGIYIFNYIHGTETFEFFTIDKLFKGAHVLKTMEYYYKDFWIIDSLSSNKSYLVLLTKDFKKLFVIEIQTDELGNFVSATRKYELDPEFILNGSAEIYSIEFIGKYVVIGSDRGLFFCKKYTGIPPIINSNYDDIRKDEVIEYLGSFAYNTYGLQVEKQITQVLYNKFEKEGISTLYDLHAKQIIVVNSVLYVAVKNFGMIMIHENPEKDAKDPIVDFEDLGSNYINDLSLNTKSTLEAFGISSDSTINSQINIIKENINKYVSPLKQLVVSKKVIIYSPKIVKLDLMINPITSLKYLGIFSNDHENFFTELVIDQDNEPYISKLIRLEDPIYFTDVLNNDSYLSFIFNQLTLEVLIIRRAMTSKIPYKSVKIPFQRIDGNKFNLSNKNITDNVYFTSFYNNKTQENSPALVIFNNTFQNIETSKNIDINPENADTIIINLYLTKYNYVFIFNPFEFSDDAFLCKFNQPGKYQILFSKFSEACTDSIDSNYAYAYCLVQNNVEIEVVGPDLTDLTKLGIILGTVLGFLTLLFLLFFTVKTQCCTEFDFFSKKKKYIPTREELYLDNYVTTKRQQKRKISKSSIVDNSSEKSNNLKKSNNFINEWHDKEQYKDDTSNMQMNKLRSSAQS